jgi:hypothetical protein
MACSKGSKGSKALSKFFTKLLLRQERLNDSPLGLHEDSGAIVKNHKYSLLF